MACKDISDLSLTTQMALFLDFDGTLAPICDDANSVSLSADDADLLLTCSDFLCGALAIISGRDLRDLAQRVPENLWRSGNHGLFIAPPNSIIPTDFPSLPDALLLALNDLTKDMDGVWLERKGPIAAVHFRAAPLYEIEILNGVEKILNRFSGYKHQHGNMIVEAKPAKANKGSFVYHQMTHRKFAGRTPIMIGDDTTDEDAFAAVQDLGGIAVKVGSGATCAMYRADTVSDVYKLIRSIS